MSRPPAVPGSSYLSVLMAVEVLDDLVATLVRKNRGKIPRDFLDWIADKMTPYLETVALDHFAKQGRRGICTAQDHREWAVGVSQWRLDQKMKGTGTARRRIPPVMRTER